MKEFRRRTVNEIADMICGNESEHFPYRSGTYLSEFFHDCGMQQYVHDGSTRKWWVAETLDKILKQPSDNPILPGKGFQTVIQILMDLADSTETDPNRQFALSELNATLAREGIEAFYADDNVCYIRSTRTGDDNRPDPLANRALSKEELDRRRRLESFIDAATEDEIVEKVVLPLLQTLRFHRISIAGHQDKAMEFGKDLWMKYCLPTGHWLYFGLQVKRGKLDAAARSRNQNIADVHRQVTMMLGHAVFDPDINKKRLVDHVIIVAGGEITKQAKHWLAEKLDASQRSQILFMDRTDILHLSVIHNVLVPSDQISNHDDDIPF